MFFAAYHAGPRRAEQYLSRGTPLPRETRAYLVAITDSGELRRNAPQPEDAGAPLFALTARAIAMPARMIADSDRHELFAVLKRADLRRERSVPTVQASPQLPAR
jgi:hypothetical protein